MKSNRKHKSKSKDGSNLKQQFQVKKDKSKRTMEITFEYIDGGSNGNTVEEP